MASVCDEDIEALGGPRRLGPGDVDRAARAFARAFSWHEPWGAWAMPDEATREERIYERFVEDMRERFIPFGECWTIGGACTTIWLPPGVPELAERRSEADYAAYGHVADEMRAGDALIRELRPDEEHWYLDTIGTEPELHGKGLGGRLLDHDLEIRDQAGHVCALDTHTPENIGFYERRGFEVTGEGKLGADLSVYMMVRPPKAPIEWPLTPETSNGAQSHGTSRRQGGDHHGLGPRHRQGDG